MPLSRGQINDSAARLGVNPEALLPYQNQFDGASGQRALESQFGGGGERTSTSASQHTIQGGSSGGGIILIFAKKITVTGSITANGGNGTASPEHAAAGAGGSVFLKAETATIGTNLVTAIGGTASVDGGSGRIRIDGCSQTGTTNPTASESEGGHAWCGQVGGII